MDEKKMTGLLIGMQKNLFNFAYSLTMNRDDAQDLLQGKHSVNHVANFVN